MSEECCTSCVAVQVLCCMLFAQIAPQNARGFLLQCNVCAIMLPFISHTYFDDIKQRLSVQLLFKFQLMPFFQDPCKILRLGRVLLGSLIISSMCYVRGCFFKFI